MSLIDRVCGGQKATWSSAWTLLLCVILSCFIVYGLVCKFLISLNLNLNSDTVSPGIMSLEIWRHNNYMLSDFYLPINNPYIFSDLLPFHLIPQIIFNFNPSCLNVMCYIIFLLIIVVFAYIVYKITSCCVNALFFAALMANIAPVSFAYYAQPVSHNATILFTGIFIILFFRIDESDVELKITPILLPALILLNAVIFSDSIIIAWFVIPITIYYFLLYKNKALISNIIIILINTSILFIYYLKKVFITNYISMPIQIRDLNTILYVNMPLYIKGMAQLLNLDASFKLVNVIHFVVFILLILSSIKFILINLQKHNIRFVSMHIFLSFTLISLAYVSSTLCVDILTTRYLTFTALSIFLLISLVCTKGRYQYTIGLTILILFSAVANYGVLDINPAPNKDNYELINYLIENDLTYGLGEYWDSNVISYLSNESVIIRPVTVLNGDIVPFRWVASERWFKSEPENFDKYFIIVKKTKSIFLNNEDVELSFRKYKPPSEAHAFGDYMIYVFNNKIPYKGFLNNNLNYINFKDSLFTQDGVGSLVDIKQLNSTIFYSNKTLNKPGYLVYGPYISLPPGNYTIEYIINAENISDPEKKIATIDIFSTYIDEDSRVAVDAERDIYLYDLNNGDFQSINLGFSIEDYNEFRLIEFRVFQHGIADLYVHSININKT